MFSSTKYFHGPSQILESSILFYRSVLVLNGNGANIAKHCVPGVPHKRCSSSPNPFLVLF